jgi:hypothetical protein
MKLCKKLSYISIVDRASKRMNGWSDRPLSRSGKETLVKAVIQAIPTYIMSCFQILVLVRGILRKAIVDHWRVVEEGKERMHWWSWEGLSTPKFFGGMGFRDLMHFNQSILGCQC